MASAPPSLSYDGERLVPGDDRLGNLLLEDLSKFVFASSYVRGKSVLDAGCGAGQGSDYLARSGADQVVGVDISPDAIRFAHAHWTQPNLAFAAMDVGRLAFPVGSFGAVTSIEVIEHLSHSEEYVKEIRRVLSPGGILVMSTPNKRISSPTPGSLWPHHIHEFYLDELRDLLSRYFSIVDIWGMSIPVYDDHPIRKAVHWLAPIFKPVLPMRLRTRFLPMVRDAIKPQLTIDDMVFSQDGVRSKPTLVAVCQV